MPENGSVSTLQALSKVWEAFFKLITIIAIPWAWTMSNHAADAREDRARMDERLKTIELRVSELAQSFADPNNRFFAKDGEELSDRVEILEELHPRASGEGP
jgi:hypothetical protein